MRVDAARMEPLVQTVPVIGRLVARRAGQVAARIAGPVESFAVAVGDRVAAGEPIAALNTETLEVQRDLARSGVAEAEADLATARAELDLARQELARIEGLRKSVAFPQGRYDDARQKVAVSEAKAARAEAAVAARRVSLDLAELNLRYGRITAPYDAVVVRRLTEVGAYVRAGDPVAELIGDRTLEVEADVPSARLAGIAPGAAIGFTLDDQRRFTAVVRAVLPSENPLTRTRAVRLVPDFAGQLDGLAEAQSVTVHVPVGTRRDVLTVHKDAVIQKPGGAMVFVVDDGKAVARDVVLGEAAGTRLEVLDGLSEGDRVVVRGNERLRPGADVRIDGAS